LEGDMMMKAIEEERKKILSFINTGMQRLMI
jgi:hypothetical protein